MSERAWSFSDSMAAAVEAAGSPVELTRDLGVGQFTKRPDEITIWIEEQRSWRETCAFADQSYHMTDHYVEGPTLWSFTPISPSTTSTTPNPARPNSSSSPTRTASTSATRSGFISTTRRL